MDKLKETIRKSVLKERRSMGKTDRSNKSIRIIDRLLSLDRFKNSGLIMCYVDFDGEVETREFIKYCIGKGKRISVPMVADNPDGKRKLRASEVFDLERDMEKGAFGILEPKKNAVREVDAAEIDLIIVPGVAFDLNKNRIGYGAGYYDMFLNKVGNNCLKAGMAFELQICANISADPHDVPMDIIITEDRIL